MLHYKIYGFWRMELLVWNSFQGKVFCLRVAMETDIWNAALAPFPPSNYASEK